MTTLERAIGLAASAHEGLQDKAGEPAILHSLRVMLRVEGTAERIAGVLHDVVEDTEWTLEKLRAEGFDDEIIDAIEALTRRPGEVYFDFCRRASRNRIARVVKLADLEDNLDPTRVASLPVEHRGLVTRYEKARTVLEES